MSTIFLFHGVGGSMIENWLPWMKKELEHAGHTVITPSFPGSFHPKLDRWMQHLEPYKDQLSGSVVVGHSLGAALTLRVLERWKPQMHATFLVAAVSGVMENMFDPVMTTFNTAPYDWDTIKRCGGWMHVIHSDNDPYIKLSKAEVLAENLGVELELIPGGGHFNTIAGYKRFPQLRDDILRSVG